MAARTVEIHVKRMYSLMQKSILLWISTTLSFVYWTKISKILQSVVFMRLSQPVEEG